MTDSLAAFEAKKEAWLMHDIEFVLGKFNALEKGSVDSFLDATGLIDDDGAPENTANEVRLINLMPYREDYVRRHSMAILKLTERKFPDLTIAPLGAGAADFSNPERVQLFFGHPLFGVGSFKNIFVDGIRPASAVTFGDQLHPQTITSEAAYSVYDAARIIYATSAVLGFGEHESAVA